MPVSSGDRATDPAVAARTLGRDGISLALIDARNRSLRWLTRFEEKGLLLGSGSSGPVPLFLIGRSGWLQEWWIVRNVLRLRGESARARGVRLPGLDPRFDECFGRDARVLLASESRPDGEALRNYLQTTLEQVLDLLSTAPESDETLFVYRSALQHEDRLAEALAVAAQSLGMPPGDAAGGLGVPPPRPARDALWLPAQRFVLGSAPGGWVPGPERWAHEESVPETEIDAQGVCWGRFVEFAEDGGYDRAEFWRPESWDWLQQQGRRAPLHVEQLRGGALVTRFGALQRAPVLQAAAHVSWHEADAWCRWAGRRLPTELEWELAASTAVSRGFVWGDVWEWAAGTARAWPQGPQVVQTDPCRRVLRGASSWTAPRVRHVRQRRFAAAERDDLFCGFRSCAA
jgi:gamma-glutamyl hercynylcysteine S-oxide synthase